jgi:hypothetical protein
VAPAWGRLCDRPSSIALIRQSGASQADVGGRPGKDNEPFPTHQIDKTTSPQDKEIDMTTTKDPSTTTSHQPLPSRLDPETAGRSDKQSPNRAGIRMPRAARLDDMSEFKTRSEGPQTARFLRAGDAH